jgi:predicted GIY-YIG superfamily endonuclease
VWYVYILRCVDGTLYVGETQDLSSRIARHEAGAASRFTCARRPVALVHSESFSTRGDALKRERQIKRWTRAKKEALIAGDPDLLKRL